MDDRVVPSDCTARTDGGGVQVCRSARSFIQTPTLMSPFLFPLYFGIHDHVAGDSRPYPLRVYYPTDDDTVVGAPLLPGKHPLVIFIHGQRDGSTFPAMCPPEYTRDYQRWSVVLGGIARSGYVVACPAVQDIVHRSGEVSARIGETIHWMRSEWEGRHTLGLPVADPEVLAGLPLEAAAVIARPHSAAPYSPVSSHPATGGLSRGSTPLALVGHSWGTRGVCAFAAANSGVAALVTIAGTFDDNVSGNDVLRAQVPTLMMCGTADRQNLAPMNGLWPNLSRPKYQAAFQGVDHWDWFGRFGAIRRCDGTPAPWRDTGHIAGELIAGFFARHVAGVAYSPPDLVRVPILRPHGIPWFEPGSAFQVRWDAPGQNFDTLPSAGTGLLGPWTEAPPW